MIKEHWEQQAQQQLAGQIAQQYGTLGNLAGACGALVGRQNIGERKVYIAIVNVCRMMAKEGISKDRKNVTQGYSFRGIDDVYNALAPLLSEAGLCILPRVLSREVVERSTAKGNALFYVTVRVEFDFVAAEDGSVHTITMYGEAMDSADKATNKAMSAAYKYACMQAFCIPTEGDNDADSNTHEVKARPFEKPHKPTDGAMDALTQSQQAIMRDIAVEIVALVNGNNPNGAVDFLDNRNLDVDEKVALWSLLDSKTRSAIKKAKEEMKKETANG